MGEAIIALIFAVFCFYTAYRLIKGPNVPFDGIN
jgi:multisubunit Na+/H+ antiporter MnhF subunit